MSKNISKPFNITLSLINIDSMTSKYKCFYGEDIQLLLKVVDEFNIPVNLLDMNARVYYVNNGASIRQDDNITITDAMQGRLKILVKRNYMRLGSNTIRVVLYDEDEETMLQPFTIECIDTDIMEEVPPEDPEYDYKSEIYKAQNIANTNQTNIGDLNTLKTTVKSDLVSGINEIVDITSSNKSELLTNIETNTSQLLTKIETNTSQLEQKANKTYVDTKIGNMGNTKVFKGSCLYSALPTSATIDDYWYVTDRTTNYCWNGISWVDIGNNLNIGENAIDEEKVSFINRDSINLFNRNSSDNLKNSTISEKGDITTSSTFFYFVSHKINVKKGDKIKVFSPGDINVFLYTDGEVFISKNTLNNNSTPLEITNDGYIRFQRYLADMNLLSESTITLIKGEEIKEYVPYGIYKLEKNLINDFLEENNDYINANTQLYVDKKLYGENYTEELINLDLKLENIGSYLNDNTTDTSKDYRNTGKVEIPKNATKVKYKGSAYNRHIVLFFDENNNIEYNILGSGAGNLKEGELSIPTNARYIVVQTSYSVINESYATIEYIKKTITGGVYKDIEEIRATITKKNDYSDIISLPTYQYVLSDEYNMFNYYPILKEHENRIVVGKADEYYSNASIRHTGKKCVINITNDNDLLSVLLYNNNSDLLYQKPFKLRCGLKTKDTGVINIHPIGDSLTDLNFQYKYIKDTLPNINFIGILYNKVTTLNHGGRTGRTIVQMVEKYNSTQTGSEGWVSEYLHPKNKSFNYYGSIEYWKYAYTQGESGTLWKTINRLGIGSNGYLTNPKVDDVMCNLGSFIKYNGTSWVAVTELELGGFEFDYKKYMEIYQVEIPNIVSIQLGTNDYTRTVHRNVETTNINYKKDMDIMINSIKETVPNVKIIISIPPYRSNKESYLFIDEVDSNKCMFELRKNIIDNYDNRENENIYVVDSSSSVDVENGYPIIGEYNADNTNFPLWAKGIVKDPTHPSESTFVEMGKRIGGAIQYIR